MRVGQGIKTCTWAALALGGSADVPVALSPGNIGGCADKKRMGASR
jgi:hypothetical protein